MYSGSATSTCTNCGCNIGILLEFRATLFLDLKIILNLTSNRKTKHYCETYFALA